MDGMSEFRGDICEHTTSTLRYESESKKSVCEREREGGGEGVCVCVRDNTLCACTRQINTLDLILSPLNGAHTHTALHTFTTTLNTLPTSTQCSNQTTYPTRLSTFFFFFFFSFLC